ncbi:hypothetical protein LUZ62_066160 [Rhynchospora pubera]|uniref:Uncharacterized protein n=1 Tax=Rhynchospora pubera TaxID=906938 RepID=A0AAV8EL14_9POAL|nr:hypothetical protein LUZ62_066160 [Rhynchospora pubera]
MFPTFDKFSEWAIDVDKAAAAVDVTKEETTWEKPSIYRVPNFIKCEKVTSFVPHVVSFGPFHHGSKDLTMLEEHKHLALCHFLNRSAKPLRFFADKLRSVLDQLLESYHGLDKRWKENPDEFLKMMILDGCFMIEVLRLKAGENGYAINDPVFGLQKVHSRIPYIKRDMLVLENQLPLLVLKLLLEVEGRGPTDYLYIHNLVLKFCGDNLKDGLQGLARHPLEVYRMSLIQSRGCVTRCSSRMQTIINKMSLIQNCVLPVRGIPRTNPRDDIRPATALRECGIRFVQSKEKSLLAIKFDCKNGKLSLPVLAIHDANIHLLLNMVVYEHMHVGAGKEITSYVVFMDELIDTAADVRLLQEKGIIKNEMGSHKLIARLFNTLAKDASPDPTSKFIEIRYQLNEFCMKSRNKWYASLKHTHFHSPWALISLVAATTVIFLTLIQTIYSALQYYHPNR